MIEDRPTPLGVQRTGHIVWWPYWQAHSHWSGSPARLRLHHSPPGKQKHVKNKQTTVLQIQGLRQVLHFLRRRTGCPRRSSPRGSCCRRVLTAGNHTDTQMNILPFGLHKMVPNVHWLRHFVTLFFKEETTNMISERKLKNDQVTNMQNARGREVEFPFPWCT